MEGDKIGGAEQRVEWNEGHRRGGRVDLRIAPYHVDVEGLCDAHHPRPHVADPDDAEPLAVQLGPQLEAVPSASRAQPAVDARNLAQQADDKAPRELRHRGRVRAWRVEHRHALTPGGLQVDLVDASAGAS